jgi:hypothetical protein
VSRLGISTLVLCAAISSVAPARKAIDFRLVFGTEGDVGRAIIDARIDLGLSTIDQLLLEQEVEKRSFYLLAGWTFRIPR